LLESQAILTIRYYPGQSDLALELDAVRAVLGHGLPSFESPALRSILSHPIVRTKGPTPLKRRENERLRTLKMARNKAHTFVAAC
jgi:hypothetical protein